MVLKRLSANDTGQTGAHQVGLYLPKAVAFSIAPQLAAHVLNPKQELVLRLISHNQVNKPVLTYYNNRLFGQTRDECRITRFGGQTSVLQQPDSTGALVCIAFRAGTGDATGWLARTPAEEERIEDLFGSVLPGVVVWQVHDATGARRRYETELAVADVCRPNPEDLPLEWLDQFPAGQVLSDEAVRLSAAEHLDPDARLLRRFRCEYELFKVIEAVHLLPRIREFTSVDAFLTVAQSALQRRKARAGRSLELHLARVFREEGVPCEWGATTETGHIPDALFPSAARYQAALLGAADIHMLAVKTTLKDRWRQVLEEADKIPRKHLFTLAEGVSVPQFEQMARAGITLVVPRENVGKFPEAVRGELMDLDGFVRLVRTA